MRTNWRLSMKTQLVQYFLLVLFLVGISSNAFAVKTNMPYSTNDAREFKTTGNCVMCSLSGIDYSGSFKNFSGANLLKSILRNANLSGLNLSKANLSEASLDGANLTDANLTGVNLTGANLGGANLSGANLTDADLSGAFLGGADLSGVIVTPNTKLPEGVMEKIVEAKQKRLADEKLAEEAEERRLAEERLAEEQQLVDIKAGKRIMDQQKRFIDIISTHADKYKKAKNDIKKSITRKKRVDALKLLFGGQNTELGDDEEMNPIEQMKWSYDCGEKIRSTSIPLQMPDNSFSRAFINGVEERIKITCDTSNAPRNFIEKKWVSNKSEWWIGTLSKITTDKDGDASVYINLGNNINIRNFTGISPSSSLYEQLGEFEEGKKIIFSGYFNLHNDFLTSGYFLWTSNLTERGTLTEPEFNFNITEVIQIN
jgi:hypothetical protein